MQYHNYNNFAKKFQIEFGMAKYKTISNKIRTSDKITNLINLSRQKKVTPNQKDYLHCLNTIVYFIFSKAETLALGSLIALERWNQECNKELYLADEYELDFIAEGILRECAQTKLNL